MDIRPDSLFPVGDCQRLFVFTKILYSSSLMLGVPELQPLAGLVQHYCKQPCGAGGPAGSL